MIFFKTFWFNYNIDFDNFCPCFYEIQFNKNLGFSMKKGLKIPIHISIDQWSLTSPCGLYFSHKWNMNCLNWKDIKIYLLYQVSEGLQLKWLGFYFYWSIRVKAPQFSFPLKTYSVVENNIGAPKFIFSALSNCRYF